VRLVVGRPVTALIALLLVVATLGGSPARAASSPAASAASVAAVGARAQRSNVPGLTTSQYMSHFVVRHGSRLYVDGRPFRFTGGNTEWLGLENYGPNASASIPLGSERYPSHFEIDDALATLHEMGATVVRAQTLGDTIGCSKCLEPTLGHFNKVAFRHMDWVVADARRYGIKLIGEFSGDANGSKASSESTDYYCSQEHLSATCGTALYTNPSLLADYVRHMRVILNHVNPYTGLAYKNDPTIMGWADGNNLLSLVPPEFDAWLTKVSAAFKKIAPHQLFIDISLLGTDFVPLPGELKVPDVDVYGQEYYPHWFPVVQGGDRIDGTAPLLHLEAASVAAAHKVYATIEWGWDNTDFLTPAALDQFLAGIESDPNVSGENFWALESHSRGHGWQPIPANNECVPTCETLEDGNWWAMYYTGLTTKSNSAADMANRAQIIRRYAYRIDGFSAAPAHERLPAPRITAIRGGRLYFEGAAGAVSYSVQKLVNGRWRAACHGCAGDLTGYWPDASQSGCYRMYGVGISSAAGPVSKPKGHCPMTNEEQTHG
jgi:hypothetical protein